MKLVSLNVESDKHLATVASFVEHENADVVALMEVCEDNLDTLVGNYPNRFFAPNFRIGQREVGVVIAARTDLVECRLFYADGNPTDFIPPHGKGTHRPLALSARVSGYALTAVHFTWTPDMSETDQQNNDLTRLLASIDTRDALMVGDFNIPRGNTPYTRLAERYTDWIPTGVVSTIDPHLHRANRLHTGLLQVVVDYVWSTPRYVVTSIQVVEGVSDHCGVVSVIDIV